MATKLFETRRLYHFNEDLPDIGENIFAYIEDNQAEESGRREVFGGVPSFFRGCGLT